MIHDHEQYRSDFKWMSNHCQYFSSCITVRRRIAAIMKQEQGSVRGYGMRVETGLVTFDWRSIADQAKLIERLGFDRMCTAELSHDPFLPLIIAAEHTERIELATSVAIAFPRSPTIAAHLARDLNDLSQGRFVLGLGTQVKGHIERRFATTWSSPGPRLRDYVEAVRSVWRSWDTGERLKHEGTFYPLSLMTPAFSPGPSRFRTVPIQIAGVNRYNLGLAGEICDGLRVHPFCTRKYLEDTIWPQVRDGAERAGRDVKTFEMVGGGFIATGKTEEQVLAAREDARSRIAFYGSTRTYLPVLETHGWGDLGMRLHRLVAEGKWDELASTISDDVLDEFCVAGTYSEILPLIRARYEGLVDTVSLDVPEEPDDPEFAGLMATVKDLSPAHQAA
jgi:probable F420-dependent oxidoreductase